MPKPKKLPLPIPVACGIVLMLLATAMTGCQTGLPGNLGLDAPRPITPPATATAPEPPASTDQSAEDALTFTTAPPPEQARYQREQVAADKSGDYPKIGHMPIAETNQLSKAKADEIRSELLNKGKENAQKGEGESLSDYQKELEALRKKARTHGKQALKKIENSSE